MRPLSWTLHSLGTGSEACATVIELPEAEYASLDDATLARTNRLLMKLADEASPQYLLLDLCKVDFLAARFIGILISVWSLLRSRGRRLAVCSLRPRCAELVRVLHLDKLFEVHPTLQGALRQIRCQLRCADPAKPVGRIRIKESCVPWNPTQVRREYVGDDGVAIYCEIVPRGRS